MATGNYDRMGQALPFTRSATSTALDRTFRWCLCSLLIAWGYAWQRCGAADAVSSRTRPLAAQDVLQQLRDHPGDLEKGLALMIGYGTQLAAITRKAAPEQADHDALWELYKPDAFLAAYDTWRDMLHRAREDGVFPHTEERELRRQSSDTHIALAVLGNTASTLRKASRQQQRWDTPKKYYAALWHPPPTARAVAASRASIAQHRAWEEKAREQEAHLQALGISPRLSELIAWKRREPVDFAESMAILGEYTDAIGRAHEARAGDGEEAERGRLALVCLGEHQTVSYFHRHARAVLSAHKGDRAARPETGKEELRQLERIVKELGEVRKASSREATEQLGLSSGKLLPQARSFPPGYPRRVTGGEASMATSYLQALAQKLSLGEYDAVARELAHIHPVERAEEESARKAIVSTVKRKRGEYLELIALLMKRDNWFALSGREMWLIRPQAGRNMLKEPAPVQVLKLYRDGDRPQWRFKDGYSILAEIQQLGLK
ncbi:MAG: hypothetical protein HN742_43160 [Lentisphaerae bacterium]|nr:hypothetical protein [Lentisphaerota bacterium]MBT4822467.1 hypothetical protein [Lentisphaerota bacterium]MBT5604286.1 hypothetical protein [Lentisphaerota bacterium]MBT7054478.1 hypothetical protein [Lentisphaerota bacterium]MBT7848738.1 hypothetical protein [Lentisphaerota bacterium]